MVNTACELKRLADGLWAAETGLRALGMPMTTRMTIARLPSGLWVHSPVPLVPLRAAVDDLGQVRWRVAPNLMHHLYQAPWQAAYPDSPLFAPPGLAAKRPDLRIDGSPVAGAASWGDDILALPVAGNPTLDETVFLHRPSGSLIITDLAVNLGPEAHWMVRLYARLMGCHGRLSLSYLLKLLYRDRQAARASLDRILSLDFDRVIPAHGPVIETGGKAALTAAFAWLKP
ncbi:hypothetical protein [Zavarzinia aquatilis]|uniref:DUF4336 domain-containing protein n=1 Tax=Zavarzinia aquatilis TaxID=2211142 RepID=A0A317EBG3_9PROT|nr:hypothetical protein [Zavarzinia aquatilis]PWR22653.1 hypothetical protein DKG74_12355 [Zavarzinia aquatilis]